MCQDILRHHRSYCCPHYRYDLHSSLFRGSHQTEVAAVTKLDLPTCFLHRDQLGAGIIGRRRVQQARCLIDDSFPTAALLAANVRNRASLIRYHNNWYLLPRQRPVQKKKTWRKVQRCTMLSLFTRSCSDSFQKSACLNCFVRFVLI